MSLQCSLKQFVCGTSIQPVFDQLTDVQKSKVLPTSCNQSQRTATRRQGIFLNRTETSIKSKKKFVASLTSLQWAGFLRSDQPEEQTLLTYAGKNPYGREGDRKQVQEEQVLRMTQLHHFSFKI